MPADKMSSRERLTAIFRGEEVDRAAVKVWAATPGATYENKQYQAIHEAAIEHTDLAIGWGCPVPFHLSATDEASIESQSRPSPHPGFETHVTILHTPKGDLVSAHEHSLEGKPGYTSKYMLETEEDARRFLSVPYKRPVIDAEAYRRRDAEVGERGITIVGLHEAMYAINHLMGSETFALWSILRRDLLHELIGEMDRRITDTAQGLLDAGIGPFFGYVGPELCIPPLQSPRDFHEFCVDYERPLIRMIHEAGGYVWIHCHNGMRTVIDGFLEMGVDVLNPIEPPPMGDATMAECRAVVGDRMALEGNIEKGDLYRGTPELIRQLVRTAFEEAMGGPFILCPTSGFAEWPTCSEEYVENYMTFIHCGLELAREIGGKPYAGGRAAGT